MADDADLSRRYRAVATGLSTEHLEDATWERLACDALSPAERAHAVEHLTRCATCADIYRGVTQLRKEAIEIDPAVPRVVRPRLTLVWGVGIAAAAALLAFVSLRTPTPIEEPVLLRAEPGKARPVPLAPIGKLSAAAAFKFEPMTGAKVHRVQLLDTDGSELWSSENLSGATVDWPASIKAAPGHYYWQVVGFPSGPASEGVASPMVDFVITSSPP